MIRELYPADVQAKIVEILGLDPSQMSFTSVSAIACALRRAAGFLAPCSEQTLVRAVCGPLRDLSDDFQTIREAVHDTLEALIVHGDLLELRDPSGTMLLYAAPPSFVRRRGGSIMLLGVAPDDVSPFPQEIADLIRHSNHVRVLSKDDGIEASEQLKELGLLELPFNVWSKSPKQETSTAFVSRMNEQLAGAGPSGDISGLILLDPERPVTYYPNRWVACVNQTGRFVGRRDQAYGAKLWCFVEVMQGRSVRIVDFPLRGSSWRGCDDAWRLQAAIDNLRGTPQVLRIRSGLDGSQCLDLFSPVPMWTRRRWDAIGELSPNPGCLFSYRFPGREIDEELQFVKDYLWLVEVG